MSWMILWFDEGGIYNVLYCIKVKEKHYIQYYLDDNISEVLKPMHKVFFNTSVGDLYYHDERV